MAAGAQIVVDLDDATTELATLSPYDIVFSIRDTTLRARYNAELFDVDSIDELLKQAWMPHARTPNAIAPLCSRPHLRAHRHAHAYRAGQEVSAALTNSPKATDGFGWRWQVDLVLQQACTAAAIGKISLLTTDAAAKIESPYTPIANEWIGDNGRGHSFRGSS